MPECSGNAASSCSNASSPPAEAPTPTMKTGWLGVFFETASLGAAALSGTERRGREFRCLFFFFM